jgi:hypothetical protein
VTELVYREQIRPVVEDGASPSTASSRRIAIGSHSVSHSLNIAFLILAGVLIIRFLRTGCIAMMAMMGGPPDAPHHDHSQHNDPAGA